jgi:hypothetical protein
MWKLFRQFKGRTWTDGAWKKGGKDIILPERDSVAGAWMEISQVSQCLLLAKYP